MKICTKCNQEKPLFHRDKTGFKTVCRDCRNDEYRANYISKKDAIRNRRKQAIINATISLLKNGDVVSVRNIIKKMNSGNVGIVNHYFGTMNNLIIAVDEFRLNNEQK